MEWWINCPPVPTPTSTNDDNNNNNKDGGNNQKLILFIVEKPYLVLQSLMVQPISNPPINAGILKKKSLIMHVLLLLHLKLIITFNKASPGAAKFIELTLITLYQ